METRKIETLKPHPLNAQIYGDSSNQELEDSISKKGILSPLLVTKESALISGCCTIVSGHRRYYAAKKIGLQEIPVIYFESTDELDIQEALIEGNRQREKNAEQKAHEYAELKRIIAAKLEREKSKKCIEAGKNGGRGKKKEDIYPQEDLFQKDEENKRVPQNSAEPFSKDTTKSENEARQEAAKKVGISHDTAEKSVKVVEVIKTLSDEGQTEQAEALRNTLNNKSVHAAYQVAKPIIAAKKPEPEKEKKPPESTFNFTNENIDWARWSWNPMTGCKHGCPYCYARDIAMRFTGHFNPEFHEDRLQAPFNTKIPKGKENEPGMNKVFVGSMTDVFGEWFSIEQIKKIFYVCEHSPQWTYLFLTKNPKRYLEFDSFPRNCWLGATADTQARFNVAVEVFSKMKYVPSVRFLSCEPLLEKIVFTEKPPVDWVIIGGQSKTSGAPEFQPQFSWVEALHYKCRFFKIPVYWKPNLVPATPKEWPGQAQRSEL